MLATPRISFQPLPCLLRLLRSPNATVPLNNTGVHLPVVQLHSKGVVGPSAACLFKFRSLCLGAARTEGCGCGLLAVFHGVHVPPPPAPRPCSDSGQLSAIPHGAVTVFVCLPPGLLGPGSLGHLGRGLLGGGPGLFPRLCPEQGPPTLRLASVAARREHGGQQPCAGRPRPAPGHSPGVIHQQGQHPSSWLLIRSQESVTLSLYLCSIPRAQ